MQTSCVVAGAAVLVERSEATVSAHFGMATATDVLESTQALSRLLEQRDHADGAFMILQR